MATYLINTLQNEIGARRRPGLRQRIGMSIALIGAILVVGETLAWFARALTEAPMRQALAGGMLGAAATALGALPLLWARPFGARAQGRLLALAAGIMLAASAFSLLIPSLDAGRALWGGNAAAAVTAGGLLLGAALVLLLERALPHAERNDAAGGGEASMPGARTRGQIWLFVAAVTLHNIPEGLAMGVGAASTGSHALSFGIAAQDIPEGMAIAVALLGAGYAPWLAVAAGAASGLVEPLAALLGAAAVGTSASILPAALAMAAGAMFLVTARDIVPEALRQAGRRPVAVALVAGFVAMMLLDTQL